jgi:hypothetical protein
MINTDTSFAGLTFKILSAINSTVPSWKPIGLLIIYLLFQWLLYAIAEKYFCKRLRKQKKYITLTDAPEKGLTQFISQLIEYPLLNRYSFFGYKNSVRANPRIISSLLLTWFATIIVMLAVDIFSIQLPGNMILALAGFFLSSFIIERKNIHDKWEYLANLYNNLIQMDYGFKRDVFECALVLDLIQMEMWSHRSFHEIFEKVLLDSMTEYYGKDPSYRPYIKRNFLEFGVNKQKAYTAICLKQKRCLEYQKRVFKKEATTTIIALVS